VPLLPAWHVLPTPIPPLDFLIASAMQGIMAQSRRSHPVLSVYKECTVQGMEIEVFAVLGMFQAFMHPPAPLAPWEIIVLIPYTLP